MSAQHSNNANAVALKEKFARFPSILLIIELILMKQATTAEVTGLRAFLQPTTVPPNLQLSPILVHENECIALVININSLEQLAASIATIPEDDLQWLERTCRGFATRVASEDEETRR